MGLGIDYELPSGVITKYHNVTLEELDWRSKNKRCAILIHSYVDQKSYLMGKSPVLVSRYIFEDGDVTNFPYPFTDIGNSTIEELTYQAAKTIPEFVNAEDDL